MSTVSERLAWILSLDSDAAIRGFQRVGSEADKNLGKVDSRIDKLGGAFTKFGAGAVATSVVAGVGLKRLADGASDLNEIVSKSNTVFKANAEEIRKWADGGARDFGQSKREALDAASAFGNMFAQLGVGSNQAAALSKQMVELASDFASFHNADITEVLIAQQAAFRGEYDAVQRFVPTINAAAVEQRALAMTSKETTKELTAQEKALAVADLLYRNAGDALGDFDRTADGAANKQRILNAELQNAKDSIGAGILPVYSQLIGALGAAAEAFNSLDDGTKKNIGTAATYGTGLLAVGGTASFVAGQIIKLGQRFTVVGEDGSRSLSKMGKAAIGVTAAITVATIVVTEWARQKAEARARTIEFTQALEKDSGALGTNTEELIRNKVAQADLNDNLAKAGITYDELVAALGDIEGAGGAVIKQLMERGELTWDEQQALGQLIDGYRDGTRELKENAAAGIKTASSIDAVGSSASAASADVDDLADRLKELRGSAFDVHDAASDSADAWAEVDEAATKTTGSARDLTSAYRAVENATRGVADAEERLAETQEGVADAQQKLVDAEKELEEVRKGPSARDLQEATLDAADAKDSLARANLRVRDAEKKLKEAQAEGDAEEIAKAELDLSQARRDVERATNKVKDEEKNLEGVRNSGKDGSPQVVEAEKNVEKAREDVEDATKKAADAERDLSDAHRAVGDAEADLTKGGGGGPVADRMKNVSEKFRDAIDADLDWIQTLIDQGASEGEIQAAIQTSATRAQEYRDKYGGSGGLNEQLAIYLDLLSKINTETAKSTEVTWEQGPGGWYYPVPKKRDMGGPGMAGVSYEIGTKEYFQPSTNGEFIPLHGAPPAASGGGITINNLTITSMSEAEARKQAHVFMDEIRRIHRGAA